jgi:flagellar hook-associated protein 3 FlgL
MKAELVKEGAKSYIKLTSLETNEIKLLKPEDDSTLVADISDEVYDKPIGNIQYEMIASKLKVQISQGVTMDYSVSASDILEFTNSDGEVLDLRQILTDIVNHLGDENSVDKLTSEDLKNMDDVISNLLKIRSEVGAKQNRMDSAKEKNTDANFNMTEILSETEDIDITEKTMEYATMQTVYLASLQTSAKVLQPSLIDYL